MLAFVNGVRFTNGIETPPPPPTETISIYEVTSVSAIIVGVLLIMR